MTNLLIFDTSLVNLEYFKLAATCPFIVVAPFADMLSVDSFLTANTTTLSTITTLGCLNIFISKSVLDYFEQQLTLLFPTISHIDILDKNSEVLQHTPKEVMLPEPLALTEPALDLALAEPISKKLNFNRRRETTYFSIELMTLFSYVPLVFPTAKPNCTNIMLIDCTIPEAQTFYDAANATTLPVMFNSNTLRGEITNLFSTNTTIHRLCIIATNRDMYNNTKLFINNEPYFTLSDLTTATATYSNNVQFMLNLIQTYAITTIDFLACESLTYTSWKEYYALLSPVCTIGASSDKTGNIAYGGNWIMESDNQTIQPIYFTNEIKDYTTTLVVTVVYIVFDPTSTYKPNGQTPIYVTTSTYDIPFNFINETTFAIYNTTAEQVTVNLASISATQTYNVVINSVTGEAGNGSYVTIEGVDKTFILGITYTYFNTTSPFVSVTNGLVGINIQNINVTLSPSMNINYRGWICGGYNGSSTLTFTSCSVTSTGNLTISGDYSGGICGGNNYNSTLTFTSCSVTSTGTLTISGDYSGGICGGYNYNSSTLTFTSCSVTSTETLTISGVASGGICGGYNYNSSTLTFTSCTIIALVSYTINGVTCESTYNYIAAALDNNTSPTTIADNGLICGNGTGVTFTKPCLLLVGNETTTFFPSADKGKPNTTYTGFTLSGMNLSGVNFSYYNLNGTTFPNTTLPYNVDYYNYATITDTTAIAKNIVKNAVAGITLSQPVTLTYTTQQMNDGGMVALVTGMNNNAMQPVGPSVIGQQMSSFVSGLYSAAMAKFNNKSINKIIVPAASLLARLPWYNSTANSNVSLINSSVYPTSNANNSPQTTVDLATILPNNNDYVYILLQNAPDVVTIVNGQNTLDVTAVNTPGALYTNNYTYSVDGGALNDLAAGGAILFANTTFYVGSIAFGAPNAVSNICFPAGTPIRTDQGSVPIDEIDITYHTINKKPIEHITQTITNDNYLICLEKDALGLNYPTRKTVMTKDHKVYYKRQMMPAYKLLTFSTRVRKVKYTGQLLYNVLLAEPSTMYVNNLLCETLHPENIIAKLYTSMYSQSYKRNIVYLLNESLKKRDLYAYKSIANRLC